MNNNSILRKSAEIHSEKYGISATLLDYGVMAKIAFEYKGKKEEIAVRRIPVKGETIEDMALNVLESYIENLHAALTERKLQLHYWYIEEVKRNGECYLMGHGIVTGHKKLQDALDIHTSEVKDISIDEKNGELVLGTINSVYHCPLEYCDFKKQDDFPDVIPNYAVLKEKYRDKLNYPSIERGKILLVISNFCKFYFHSLYYIPTDSKEEKTLNYTAYPHIGMYQDSFLIETEDYKIDLRYFPHYQNIQFYAERTNGCPLFIENIGDVVLYAETHCGTIKLLSNERKEIKEENAEKYPPELPGGDLYPVVIVE